MDKQTQRTEIAKTCGWEHANTLRHFPENNEDYLWWHPVEKTVSTFDNLPDYLNNLDDMHEAEKGLSDEQYEKYRQIVVQINFDSISPIRTMCPITATAAQRAEAFLKTLNLWQPIK